MRRPDAPDYYLLRRFADVFWWGRSRVLSILLFGAACDRQLVSNTNEGALDCARPGIANLPASIARMAVAFGAPAPGPRSDARQYRYSLPDRWLRLEIITGLWPGAAGASDLSVLPNVAWIEAAIRSRRGRRAVAMPSAIRSALAGSKSSEIARLSTVRRIPVELLPLLVDLARRLARLPLN
jgi:hypothetical protein